MADTIIWLHDKGLSLRHPLFEHAGADAPCFFIWDDDYFKQRAYSLKRLVFIYETLCEMPIQIVQGNTLDIFAEMRPQKIITPYTADTEINRLIKQLANSFAVETVRAKSFSMAPNDDVKRFFKYWNKAKKTALLTDAGQKYE
jgi:hypothetical protein